MRPEGALESIPYIFFIVGNIVFFKQQQEFLFIIPCTHSGCCYWVHLTENLTGRAYLEMWYRLPLLKTVKGEFLIIFEIRNAGKGLILKV